MKARRTVTVNLHPDHELLVAAEKAASEQGIPVSKAMRLLTEEYATDRAELEQSRVTIAALQSEIAALRSDLAGRKQEEDEAMIAMALRIVANRMLAMSQDSELRVVAKRMLAMSQDMSR